MADLKIVAEKAKFYAKELWGLDFDLPIVMNNRYKNVMGSLYYKDRKRKIPEKIMLAGYIFDVKYYDELIVDDTLLHELCHWYCSIYGKQSNDGSKDFETELRRIGASTSGLIINGGISYIGRCKKCGKKVATKSSKHVLSKLLNTDRYSTKCCHAQIVDGGIEETKSTYEVSDKVKELNRKFKECVNDKMTNKC